MATSNQESTSQGPAKPTGAERPLYTLREIADRMWEWDYVVKAAHLTNCGQMNTCSLNVYVKDGVVLREEQTGNYPSRNDPEAPDFNPRGCQHGLCYSQSMYDARRIQYPLKRVGARGEGRWQRISWDQALSEIADTIIDVLVTDGPDAIVDTGSSRRASHASVLGQTGFFSALGSPLSSIPSENGDDFQGFQETFGKACFASSADNWFYADIIFIWGGNPAYTQVTNFHFISEARYRGARVVVISPDYNPSAICADYWVPVNMGSDAALALSIAQVIIEEKLYNTDFVREQTDSPILVRRDSKKFLRERDIKRGGQDDTFYVWDLKAGKLAEAPKKTLVLGDLVPALEGEYEVQTQKGRIKVAPVFQLLKEHVQSYKPEEASRIVGVAPEVIVQLAREIAQAKTVSIIPNMGWGKFYHCNLYERGMVLPLCLCGHIGKKGAGPSGFGLLGPDTAIGGMERRLDQVLLTAVAVDSRMAHWKQEGYTDEMIVNEYARDAFSSGNVQASSLFYYIHGGLLDPCLKNNNWDPYLKRPLAAYLKEAFDRKWQFVRPSPGRNPKVLITCRGGFLRRSRSTNQLLKELLPKVRLMVTLDPRMSSTALFSDYVLPVCGWYEKESTHASGGLITPYIHYNQKAVEPLFESKSDWEIFILLARKIEQRARERGILTYTDSQGQERRLDNLEGKITFGGLYTEKDEDMIARDVFLNASNVESMEWEKFQQNGIAHYAGVPDTQALGLASEIVPGEPVVAFTWHTQEKRPYPTLTRRIEFYIDHDWYLELGEAFTVHKEQPKAGGNYPLRLTGGHARWSTHADWADDPLMLRLQRGQPTMFVSVPDARDRDIQDGDTVEVFNDVGTFQINVSVSPCVHPGQVMIYHSWENSQFPSKKHFKSVMASPLNPLELIGDYFHLRPNMFNCTPGQSDRDTRVEVQKVRG